MRFKQNRNDHRSSILSFLLSLEAQSVFNHLDLIVSWYKYAKAYCNMTLQTYPRYTVT